MNKGYSLIELMVVIAIIAALSAFAIPNYKNYVLKANVLELFTLAQEPKLLITEALITNTPPEAINNQTLQIVKHPTRGKAQEVLVENATITITGNGKKLGLSNNQKLTLTFTPIFEQNSLYWQCSANAEFKAYLPAPCQ